MEQKETRGRKKNPLYFGINWGYKRLRVPKYSRFQEIAKQRDISVVELIFIILLQYLEQENSNNESIRKDKKPRGGE